MPTRSQTPPLPDEVEFVAYHGGKVHVVATTPEDDDAQPALRRIGDGPTDLIAHLLGAVGTRCGRTIDRHRDGGMNSAGSLLSCFPDDRLCAACHASVAPEDQARLFEHPQGDDDADD